jgi:hypothetical protein
MDDGKDEKRALADLLLGDPEIVAWLGGHRPKPDDGDEETPDDAR